MIGQIDTEFADARCLGTNSPSTWTSSLGQEGAQTYGCTGSHSYLGWNTRLSGAYVYIVANIDGAWKTVPGSKNSSSSQLNYYFTDSDGIAPLRLTSCSPSGCVYDQFNNYGF
jgi:hypothetical protein